MAMASAPQSCAMRWHGLGAARDDRRPEPTRGAPEPARGALGPRGASLADRVRSPWWLHRAPRLPRSGALALRPRPRAPTRGARLRLPGLAARARLARGGGRRRGAGRVIL